MSIIFNREDWKLFRTIDTLCQKAGVSRELLPRLVVKELVDNALDVCESAEVGYVVDQEDGVIYVQDDGDGIDPKLLPMMFCINRPMISSKLLRLPTRGALGNGLRVVMGAVVAGGGWIRIATRGWVYEVISNDQDGSSQINKREPWKGSGTRIEFQLGSLQLDQHTLLWGKNAIVLARGQKYKGKTSPYWYTSEAFFEMLNASDAMILDLLSYIDVKKSVLQGIHQKIGYVRCNEVSFEDSEWILGHLRDNSKNITAKQIGSVGDSLNGAYAMKAGYFSLRGARGQHRAEIPVVIEMWTHEEDRANFLNVNVNKSPIVSPVRLYLQGNQVSLYGGGISVSSGKTKLKNIFVELNIITPYMPITSDGKAPNFIPMESLIQEVLSKSVAALTKNKKQQALHEASKAASEEVAGGSDDEEPLILIRNEKDVLFAYLNAAVKEVSENGHYEFSLRQLYYALRPRIIETLGKEPDYNYFGRCITEWEATRGDIIGLYRDPRGTLYTPHTKQEIPIGTKSVQAYKRPEWTFNRILYSEKEGLFPALKQVNFPERFDCALLSSKGFASRAVRDLLDMLGDDGEDIEFFCIHDGDNAGTLIYETLQEETKARKGRKVKIINLGIEPWEGRDMNLQVETFTGSDKRRRPTAQYVKDYGDWDTDWDDWLQTHRIELNAMSPALFIRWLEEKFIAYDDGKLVPPEDVLLKQLRTNADNNVRQIIRDRILREAGFEDQVAEVMADVEAAIKPRMNLRREVEEDLLENRVRQWTAPIRDIAREIVEIQIGETTTTEEE